MRPRCLIAASVVAACAPTLDWREVRLPEVGVSALFPCKPTEQARRITLAGVQVHMTLLACEAGGATWALAHADVADPAKVSQALDQLAESTLRNIDAHSPSSRPAAVSGMTPNPASRRLRAVGLSADGARLHGDVTVFAKGTRVFQATVLSAKPDEAGPDTFVASIRRT